MKRKIRKELPLPNRVLIRDSLLLLGLFISDVPFLDLSYNFPKPFANDYSIRLQIFRICR